MRLENIAESVVGKSRVKGKAYEPDYDVLVTSGPEGLVVRGL
jgi:hypothetical protein